MAQTIRQKDPVRITTRSRLKSIVRGSIGNMIEWYDWYVYAAFQFILPKLFFLTAILLRNY